jgi:hypothetical protein
LKQALTQARYPLSRVSFGTSYGSGRLVTFWWARSKEELAAAPTIAAAVTEVLGPTKTDALLSAMARSVIRREEHTAVRRDDLTSI